MSRPAHIHSLLTTLLMLVAFASPARAVGTPAGATITNVAEVEFVEGGTGTLPTVVSSNTVTTTVAAVCAVSVTPDGTAAAPGQRVELDPTRTGLLRYTVLNAGNDRHTLDLTWALAAGSTFLPDASRVRLVHDIDASGTIDPGEPLVTSLTLDADTSTHVLLEVGTRDLDVGTAFLDLVASCPGGPADRDNVGALVVRAVTHMAVQKTFAAATVTPGGTVDVTIRATNTGNVPVTDAQIADALDTDDLRGLALVPGSTTADAGALLYTPDGTTWTGDPTGARALRWTLPTLAPGTSLALTFRMRADLRTPPGTRTNRAVLTYAGRTLQGAAQTIVGSRPAVALGPVGNPEAAPRGEGSPDDWQQATDAVLGQPTCLRHTLLNSGNIPDEYRLAASVVEGAADVTFESVAGGSLAQPVTLASGASMDFRVCLTPRQAVALKVLLEATSASGAAANRTTDEIDRVGQLRPDSGVALRKSVSPEGAVAPGTVLTYTLELTNPYTVTLTNLVVRDTLDAGLEFVSAEGGSFDAATGRVTWTVASLAPAQTTRLTLRARVRPEAQDGQAVPNTFTFTSDQTQTPLVSNETVSPVWSAGLGIEKTADTASVRVGDRLGFTLKVTNLSRVGSLRIVDVTDLLPRGLVYVPGTSRVNGQPVPDPTNGLSWNVGPLGPGQSATIQFVTRVTPEAPRDLVNVARATAVGFNGAVLSTGQVTAAVRSDLGPLAITNDLIGRVYVDENLDGDFDERHDTPVVRARVVLSDGRFVLTDTQGRYHVRDVTGPTVALRLDPNSTPHPALAVPQDGGLRGTRTVPVNRLTSVDFPLAPLHGEIRVLRETTLRVGPVEVLKRVTAQGATYRVQLVVRAERPLQGVLLEDPLPTGASLVRGLNRVQLGGVPVGESVVTYEFTFPGGPADATTDPTVTRSAP